MLNGKLLLAMVALALATAAAAQSLADERRRLHEARVQAEQAEARARELERRSAAQRDQAARTRADAAALAGRIQSAEARIAAARARLALIDRLRARQRARLAEKQQPAVRLVAALQAMTRRPPVVAIARPGSLDDLVHVRAVMATMLPAVAERTAGLRAEVERGRRLREEAVRSLASIRTGQRRLEAERVALARLEAVQRQRARSLGRSALFEADRATALGEQARDIGALMEELEDQSEARERLASLPGPLLRPALPGAMATPAPEPTRETQRRIAYRLPVVGRIVTGFGEISDAGVHSRGLAIATAPLAQVVAPLAGRIAFAGPYRGYGGIVIIDHGDGLTSLIANLGQVAATVGATVDAGSPLGRAGPGRPTVTVELRRNGTPINIAPLII